jgi:hypothetical protein
MDRADIVCLTDPHLVAYYCDTVKFNLIDENRYLCHFSCFSPPSDFKYEETYQLIMNCELTCQFFYHLNQSLS